eukprot:s940_g3.t1
MALALIRTRLNELENDFVADAGGPPSPAAAAQTGAPAPSTAAQTGTTLADADFDDLWDSMMDDDKSKPARLCDSAISWPLKRSQGLFGKGLIRHYRLSLMSSGDMAAACRAATMSDLSPAEIDLLQRAMNGELSVEVVSPPTAGPDNTSLAEGRCTPTPATSSLVPQPALAVKEEVQRARLYRIPESEFIQGPDMTAEASKRKLHQEMLKREGAILWHMMGPASPSAGLKALRSLLKEPPATSSKATEDEAAGSAAPDMLQTAALRVRSAKSRSSARQPQTRNSDDASTRLRLAMAMRKAQRDHSAAEIAAERVRQLSTSTRSDRSVATRRLRKAAQNIENTRLAFEAVIQCAVAPAGKRQTSPEAQASLRCTALRAATSRVHEDTLHVRLTSDTCRPSGLAILTRGPQKG